MDFERHFAFQNAYNYIFSRKNNLKKICVPTLPEFSDLLPYTLIFVLSE